MVEFGESIYIFVHQVEIILVGLCRSNHANSVGMTLLLGCELRCLHPIMSSRGWHLDKCKAGHMKEDEDTQSHRPSIFRKKWILLEKSK